MKRGRVVTRLAAKLQQQFPSVGIVQLLWLPENLFPATGAYRSNVNLDCCSWEGSALGVRADGSTYTAFSVHSYTRMSDLIKPGMLVWHSNNEITKE